MAQTTLPNSEFSTYILNDACIINPESSYSINYIGNKNFDYVELSCDGCEFKGPNSSNYLDDCIAFYNFNSGHSNCDGCDECDCESSNCKQFGGSLLGDVRLNSTDLTLKFYGEVHSTDDDDNPVIDDYKWERELDLTVPNITQIEDLGNGDYRAIDDREPLDDFCLNFFYKWYVDGNLEETSTSPIFIFNPQINDCDEHEIKAEIEQDFGSSTGNRTGESTTITASRPESCCLANERGTPTVSSNTFVLGCDGPDLNLTSLHTGQYPDQSILVWSLDDDASDGVDDWIVPPTISTAGEYYGYYFDSDPGCYSNGGVKVTVEDFTNPPTFTDYQLYFDCPVFEIDLHNLLVEDIPSGIEVRYSTDWEPTGGPSGGVANTVTQVIWTQNDLPAGGLYWAYYYNPVTDCFSPPSSKPLTLNGTFQGFFYDIQADEVWDNKNEEIYELRIDEDVELTIKNSTLMMHPDTRIHIHEDATLILDNVVLDNNFMEQCGDVKWKGIFLYENSELVMNGSTIRKAETGIAFNGLKPQQSSLTMTNSTIRDCDIGVYMVRRGQKETSIKGSEFINNRRGIYSRNHNNLVIEGSEFINHQDAGIVISDGEAVINGGNKFDVGFAGIKIEATRPMSTDVVIGDMDEDKNVFSNVDFGILINGAFGQLASVFAENNEIETPGHLLLGAAFMAWGENSYRFVNNKVESGILRSYYSGSGFNRMSCNDIESSIQYYGTNANSDFLENDIMGSTPVRMNVDLFGSPTRIVRENIGMNDEAAGNCFKGPNKDILNFGPSFTYHYYNNEACEEPDDPNNSFNKNFTNDEAGRCDGRGLFNLIDPDGDNEAGFDPAFGTISHISESQVLDSIIHWIQEVISLGGDDIRTMQVEGYSPISSQLDLANEILNQWLNYALYRSEHEESTFSNQIFQLTGSYDWKTREFGYRVSEGDLFTADTILQSLPMADSNQQIFFDTQVLNLKRLEIEDSLAANNYNVFSEDSLRVLYFDADSAIAHGRPYFTETDVANIESMGETITPSAAYARTLYYQLTGNHIDIPALESGDGFSELLLGAQDPISEGIDIYPNPFSEEISIQVDEPILRVEIFGLNGELMQQLQPNQTRVTLRTNGLMPGLYLLQIQTTSGQTVHKVIKQ